MEAIVRMMTRMDPKGLCQLLGLQPLPLEGGFYRETYCSEDPSATAIYYLLTPETHSALHRLPGDELYHFYLGDPVEMLILEEGKGELRTLGCDIEKGIFPQVLVPGEAWQGSRLKEGGAFALMGTTMSPGFSFDQYEAGDSTKLAREYPAFASFISSIQ